MVPVARRGGVWGFVRRRCVWETRGDEGHSDAQNAPPVDRAGEEMNDTDALCFDGELL